MSDFDSEDSVDDAQSDDTENLMMAGFIFSSVSAEFSIQFSDLQGILILFDRNSSIFVNSLWFSG